MKKQLEYLYSDRIRQKIYDVRNDLLKMGIKEFYVAGGAFYSSNDIDIFPVTKTSFVDVDFSELTILSQTKNATTVKLSGGAIVQLCNYFRDSLKSLVDSFDYTHCQIGALMHIGEEHALVTEMYFTDEFVVAQAIHQTEYTKSDYPLSSLFRAVKYAQRDWFTGRSYIKSMIKCTIDVINRGFKDYDDFKNQMDAVDLGLIPADICDIEDRRELLSELYDLLKK